MNFNVHITTGTANDINILLYQFEHHRIPVTIHFWGSAKHGFNPNIVLHDYAEIQYPDSWAILHYIEITPDGEHVLFMEPHLLIPFDMKKLADPQPSPFLFAKGLFYFQKNETLVAAIQEVLDDKERFFITVENGLDWLMAKLPSSPIPVEFKPHAQWFEISKDEIRATYNRASGLYADLPNKANIELIDTNGHEFTLDTLKNVLSSFFMGGGSLYHVTLSGTPELAKDFLPIVKWFDSNAVPITIHTTGELHSGEGEDWWGNLMSTLQPIHTVKFTESQFMIHGPFGPRIHVYDIHPDIHNLESLKKHQQKVASRPAHSDTAVVWCRAKIEQRFFLAANGNVFPCDWTGHEMDRAKDGNPYAPAPFIYDWDENNVFNTPLVDILRGTFFTEYMKETLSVAPSTFCQSMCRRLL